MTSERESRKGNSSSEEIKSTPRKEKRKKTKSGKSKKRLP